MGLEFGEKSGLETGARFVSAHRARRSRDGMSLGDAQKQAGDAGQLVGRGQGQAALFSSGSRDTGAEAPGSAGRQGSEVGGWGEHQGTRRWSF